MNHDAIAGVIRGARRECRFGHSEDGPVCGIRLENGKYANGKSWVWGLIPIDDESNVRFANFLVSEARRIEADATVQPITLGRPYRIPIHQPFDGAVAEQKAAWLPNIEAVHFYPTRHADPNLRFAVSWRCDLCADFSITGMSPGVLAPDTIAKMQEHVRSVHENKKSIAAPSKSAISESTFDVASLKFYDQANHREMMYVYPDTKHWTAGWLLFKTKGGEWVTLRKATDEDIESLSMAVVRAHHCQLESQ